MVMRPWSTRPLIVTLLMDVSAKISAATAPWPTTLLWMVRLPMVMEKTAPPVCVPAMREPPTTSEPMLPVLITPLAAEGSAAAAPPRVAGGGFAGRRAAGVVAADLRRAEIAEHEAGLRGRAADDGAADGESLD